MDPILAAVLDQAFFQLLWQKDRPLLAFVVNGNISPFQCFPCDKPVFTDPDAGTADCLDHQEQTAAGFRLCRQSQPVVLFFWIKSKKRFTDTSILLALVVLYPSMIACL